jgi:hypothetical protein
MKAATGEIVHEDEDPFEVIDDENDEDFQLDDAIDHDDAKSDLAVNWNQISNKFERETCSSSLRSCCKTFAGADEEVKVRDERVPDQTKSSVFKVMSILSWLSLEILD